MANSWWEIQVLCDPSLEETVFWRLSDFGCRGTAVEVRSNGYFIRGYLPQERAHVLDLGALSLLLRQDALAIGFPPPITQWVILDEEDWASNWMKFWEPQEIGDRFLINPAWLPMPQNPNRLVMRLDPGLAFGTGAHATTQLCLESLEMRLGNGVTESRIADIGCGSGILAIGAALLGAAKIYAVDIDELAVKSARENRDLNQIVQERLVIEQGSVEELITLVDEPVDGILCNILAEVVVDLLPQLTPIVKPTTWGVISGVLLDQAKAVADSLEQNGWMVATLWRRQDWCCLNIRRSS